MEDKRTLIIFYTVDGVEKTKTTQIHRYALHEECVDLIDKIMGGNDKWDFYEIEY